MLDRFAAFFGLPAGVRRLIASMLLKLPPQAWEQIEIGRYMPRRIRGSFRGRELG